MRLASLKRDKIIFTQRALAPGSAVDYLLVPDDD
jgi:hypothetical protein